MNLAAAAGDVREAQSLNEALGESGRDFLPEHAVALGLVLCVQLRRPQLQRVDVQETAVGPPHVDLKRAVLVVPRARQQEAHAQLALDRFRRFFAESPIGHVPAVPVARDPLGRVERACERGIAEKAQQRFAPAERFVAVEFADRERHVQALADGRELVGHKKVPEHLEVLDRDRVAVVIVRDHLRLGADRLPLRNGLDDRRPRVADRRRSLSCPVAKLLKRAGCERPRVVLPGVGGRGADAAGRAAEDPGGAADETGADPAGDAPRCRARTAVRFFRQV